MTVTERVYDEVGITTGATVDPYVNQATLGIRNDEGFIELKDDDGNITWRMDDTGMLFEEGGTIVEATDGEIVITTSGSDPDFTLQSITIANALVYDNSTPEFVFFGELGIDRTLGGRITFASNSYIVEEADGALVVRAVGTDPDITLETNTVSAALFLDQAVPEWVFFGELGIDNTLGGRITFASNSYIVEEADGALVVRAVGTDPDITLETNTVSAALFLDQAVPEWVFFGELGIDNTLGGRITFASNSYIVEEADGAIVLRAVGTDPDITLETNTVTAALFLDQAVPEWVFFGEVGIDNTAGGRITFSLGSNIQESLTAGVLTIAATGGTDPDLVLGTVGFPSNISLDNSDNRINIGSSAVGEVYFVSGKFRMTATDVPRLTFTPGSQIAIDTDGAGVFNMSGTDPDLTLSSDNKTFIFCDDSASTAMFFGTKVRIDTTGAADGGGFTFEPGGVFRVTATTGVTTFRAVGTNPDLQLGATTYVNAIYFDHSLANLALLAGTDTAQSMTVGAATIATANRGRVDIYQRGTADALPVLFLSQLDVSEQFFMFEGTSLNANVTQTIVAQASVTTTTLAGWLKVYVEDDGPGVTDGNFFIPFYTLT
jgi:hypothetical protein